MKLSIVIPVYNEAEQLEACLLAISRQKLKPHQVIVVDNNSSDNTEFIARSFGFVTVLQQKTQGVVHARTLGFDKASGDIIARIDGDTVIPEDWTANIKRIFIDESIDAVTGVANYYNVAASDLVDSVDLFFRRSLSKKLKKDMYLWGANMAIRRKAWTAVRNSLCNSGNLHEDFDIAIHLTAIGGNIIQDEKLTAFVSSRRIDMNFLDFMSYVNMSPRTYALHKIKVKKHIYPVVMVCALCYLPGKILYRGYDKELDKFSWAHLVSPRPTLSRVDPTANVA